VTRWLLHCALQPPYTQILSKLFNPTCQNCASAGIMSMLKGSLPFVSLGNHKPFAAIRLDWKQKPSSKITNGSMNYELCPGTSSDPKFQHQVKHCPWGVHLQPLLGHAAIPIKFCSHPRSMKSARILCRVEKVGSQRVVNRHLTPPFQGDPENQSPGHPP
jgi:hypothetical protein